MIYFCERIGADISALVDGERPDGLDAASVEAHVRSCSYCSAQRRRLEQARDLVDQGATSSPPERVWDSIEEALRKDGLIK